MIISFFVAKYLQYSLHYYHDTRFLHTPEYVKFFCSSTMNDFTNNKFFSNISLTIGETNTTVTVVSYTDVAKVSNTQTRMRIQLKYGYGTPWGEVKSGFRMVQMPRVWVSRAII